MLTTFPPLEFPIKEKMSATTPIGITIQYIQPSKGIKAIKPITPAIMAVILANVFILLILNLKILLTHNF